MKTKRPGLRLDLQNAVQTKRAKILLESAGANASEAHLAVGCLSPTDCGEKPTELAIPGQTGFAAAVTDGPRTIGLNYDLVVSAADNKLDCDQPKKCIDRRNGHVKLCKKLSMTNFRVISEVLTRFLNYRGFHDAATIEMIIPPGSELVADNDGKYYWITPDHHGDMHSWVRERKGFNEEETRHFYRQIVALVACCHETGIVLRDLKLRKFVFTNADRTELRLENLDDVILFDPNGDDMLVERHGCPAYVSPELLNPGKPRYSGRAADLWSLGILLFVLLLGRYPFYDPTPFGLFMKIRQCRLGIPDKSGKGERLSREVVFLIRSLLRKAPAERLSAVELLTHPWLKSRNVRQLLGNIPTGTVGRASLDPDNDAESVPSRRAPADWKTGSRLATADDQLVPSIDVDGIAESSPPSVAHSNLMVANAKSEVPQ